MGRKLAATVHLTADNGEIITYLPGDEPAAEHAEQITNPDAWELRQPPADPNSAGLVSDPGQALLEALLGDDDTVTAWLAASNVPAVLDAVDALPEDYRTPAVDVLVRLEQNGRARKTLLDAFGA